MLHTVYLQAKSESTALNTLRISFKEFPNTSRLLLLDSEYELFLGYALSPRKVLTIKSQLNSTQSRDKAISLFNPDYLITTNVTAANALTRENSDQSFSTSMGTFHLYKNEEIMVNIRTTH